MTASDAGNPAQGISHRRGDPIAACRDWLTQDEPVAPAMLLVSFDLPQYWLEGAPVLALTALYCLGETGLSISVTDAELGPVSGSPEAYYLEQARQHRFVCVSPGEALSLAPLAIPKPWGQEIWYSGVEERGVCCFAQGNARTPIPWLQAVMPDNALGDPGEDLVLLKILDPAPEPVTGDLYFELHDEKREVYVVTHVDREAWPEGRGAIRYGFNPDKIEAAGSEQAFRQQYLDAVRAYEAVRREIDALPAGNTADSALLESEAQLREKMNAFTALRPLDVGDVVVVPLLLPHSLQHGVRTIEFQTPVYERKILSFAQRVLTQDHWDTEEAVSRMSLLPPTTEAHELIASESGGRVERIVDFEDFEVWRVTLAAGASYPIMAAGHYRILMAVSGNIGIDEAQCGPEEAMILPAGQALQIHAKTVAGEAVFLLAFPRA